MTARTRLRPILVLVVVLATVAGTVATPVAGAGTAQTTDCSFPVTVTDATGTEVTIQSEPETVVTAAPSAAQTMWEIGAREKVIGLTKYADYLEGSSSRTNVSGGGLSYVVVEEVVALDPDLVLAPNVIGNQTVEKLRQSGLTVVRFSKARSLADVAEKTRRIGRLVGACEGANERAREMKRSLERVREAVAGTERPPVLYYMGGSYTAGSGTFIHAVIETAGGRNVAAAAGIRGYRRISSEVVVTRDPSWILRSSNAGPLPDAYNQTTAVQSGQVLTLNADYLNQPAPRTVAVVERLAKTLHPEAFAAANRTTTTTTATETTTRSTSETTSQSTTSTSTPGLGVVTALASLTLLAAGIRLRG
ncbi:MAG: PGF-CTERM-anchored ABC transporter substrate-binding protein [Halanaeroarchaeum sp.]